MSSISQTIPNFIFGISEQPDYLKKPGQVVDSVNVTPDVTRGLIKRPGTRFLANVVDDAGGTWFNYYRDQNEQYVGHIATDGEVTINNAITGVAATVTQSAATQTYLSHTNRDEIQTCTVNDYTFVTNRTTNTAFNNTLSATPPNEGWAELRIVAYGRTYEIEVRNQNGGLIGTATVTTSADTSTAISAGTILSDLEADLDGMTNITATVIGNGIHIIGQNGQRFSLRSDDPSLITVFTDQVNNVERLPFQCHHGYLVKIVNSASDDDDFFAVFQGKNNQDGDGVWVETVGWTRNANGTYTGINTTFDPTTMPHVIISTGVNTFTVAPCDGTEIDVGGVDVSMSFADREVGDLDTNPTPSFVGNPINNIILFRNRLSFLSGENIICTTSGGLRPLDFFSTSAVTSLATDPIDISASSKEPAILWDAIEVNNGLLLFATSQQYLLTTDSDLLTQETAKLNAIGYFQYDNRVSPFSLGTSIGFVDNAGGNFKFFEMASITRDNEPTVIEQSKIVSTLVTDNIFKVCNTRESGLVLFACDDDDNEHIIWGYSYFEGGPERILSSWFKWEFPGEVLYHCIMRDRYYIVLRYETTPGVFNNQLLVADVRPTENTSFADFNDRLFRIHLDNRVTIDDADITYDAATDTSSWDMPQNNGQPQVFDQRDIFAYTTADGDNQGRLSEVTITAGTPQTCSVDGDWSNEDLEMGYTFSTDVTLPHFFVSEKDGQSYRAQSRASLIIHRLYVETGDTGMYEFTLERLGKDDYTETRDATMMNTYRANDPVLTESMSTYLPAYERNTNLTLRLHSEHPSPFALFSVTWEGDFSNRYYRSV